MSVDRYTKAVLTVIAVCLVWMSLGGPALMTPLQAQDAGRVVLTGWVDERGILRKFPYVGWRGEPAGLPTWIP